MIAAAISNFVLCLFRNLRILNPKYCAPVFVLIGTIAAFDSPVLAQGNISGSFEGIVIEKISGKIIPGATATFKNRDTGSQITAKVGDDGRFSKSSLAPGEYEIEVRASGYLPEKKIQILFAMRPNKVEPEPFELTKETAAVTSIPSSQTSPPTTTTSPTTATLGQDNRTTNDEDQTIILNPRRGAAFDIRGVRNLPLGGTTLTRTFDELAFLVPGVNPPPQAIGNSVGPGVGGGVGTSGQFSVNGLRSRANNFTVDGSDNNDEDIGVRRQGFFTLVPQPIESIQEFQIITLLAPAEFGRNLGAQVNALSKSGGNQFHGTIFGLGNADFLNARNFFDNASGDTTTALTGRRPSDGASIPVLVDGQQKQLLFDAGEKDAFALLQGGFAIGGPIVRDKMFFFVSGEGQYLDGTKERNFAVPTVEQRGLFNSGVTGLQQCQGAIVGGICRDAAGNPVNYRSGYPTSAGGDAVFSLFPFANNPSGIYGRNTYTQALSTDARGRIFSVKYDYNFRLFNQQQTFTSRYNYTDDKRDLTDVGGALFSAIRPMVRNDNFSSYLSGGLTDNISNELRFSWGRTRLRFEELRDGTGFLLPPSGTQVAGSDERRFLLNARTVYNETLPVGCSPTSCFAPSQVRYTTFQTTESTGLGLVGQLVVAGFSPVGVDVFNFPQQRVNNTFQAADTLRWQSGQHHLAFGTDLRKTFLDSDLPRNSRPLATFNGGIRVSPTSGAIQGFSNPLDLAASGAASGFFQTLVTPGTDSQISLSYYQLNFFAQDEWRVLRNLSLNFGLRYEFNTTPKEADRKIEETFGITPPSFLSGLKEVIDGRTSIYESDRNNFAPRLGVAYAPTSSTVIRGGGGVYYDQIIGAVVSQSRNVFPRFLTTNFGGGVLVDNNGLFTLFNPRNAIFDPALGFVCNSRDIFRACSASSLPLIRPGTLNTINPFAQLNAALANIFTLFPERGNGSPFGVTLPTRELDTPLSYQYSIGIEQRLFRDTFLSAAYVGTSGRKLLRFTTPNLGSNYVVAIDRVTLTPNCGSTVFVGCDPQVFGTTLTPFNGSDYAVPFAGIGPVNRFETTGRSSYNSLQIELRGRLSHSFQYRANYVNGKVNDDVSDVFDLAGAFALPQNSITFRGEYAPANFDVRHRFTYNFIYDTPELKNQHSVVKFLLGGWQIAGTGKFSTGQPFTVNSVFDVNLDGNLTDRLNNTRLITVTGDRRQPLTLSSISNLTSMLADFGKDGSVPRNSFRAGSILELDLAFAKRFRFRETQDVQVRVDVFNFINRANFGIPVRFLEAPGFGQATDTITPGRRIQLALKYNF